MECPASLLQIYNIFPLKANSVKMGMFCCLLNYSENVCLCDWLIYSMLWPYCVGLFDSDSLFHFHVIILKGGSGVGYFSFGYLYGIIALLISA